MNTKVIKLSTGDIGLLQQLLNVYKEAFELTNQRWPAPAYLEQLLNNPAMIFMVAVADEKIVGGFTAYILPSVYSTSAELYLYDMAVASEYQRKGVGSLLLTGLKELAVEMGCGNFFVQADLPDKHAVEFYAKNGGVPSEVVQFSFNFPAH